MGSISDVYIQPYTGCPKKSVTLDFRYIEIWKYSIFWFHQIKHCLLKRNYTKIIWFGMIVLILQPFLETQSFTNFVKMLNVCELFTAGIAVHKFSLCFVCKDQWTSGQQGMEVRKTIIPEWNVMRIKRKLTMTVFWEMTIESKLLQPIPMILVSFLSEDNVLSEEIKICYIFEYQSYENQAFCFFLDTRYIHVPFTCLALDKMCMLVSNDDTPTTAI